MRAHLPRIRPRDSTNRAERATYETLLSRSSGVLTPLSPPPKYTQPSVQPSRNYLVILCRLSRKEYNFLEQDPFHLRIRINISLLSSLRLFRAMTHPSESARVPCQLLRSRLAFCKEPGAETGTASAYVCAYICAHASAHLVDQLKKASGDGDKVPMFSVKSCVSQAVRGVILSLPILPTISTPLHFVRVFHAKQRAGSAYLAMRLFNLQQYTACGFRKKFGATRYRVRKNSRLVKFKRDGEGSPSPRVRQLVHQEALPSKGRDHMFVVLFMDSISATKGCASGGYLRFSVGEVFYPQSHCNPLIILRKTYGRGKAQDLGAVCCQWEILVWKALCSMIRYECKTLS